MKWMICVIILKVGDNSVFADINLTLTSNIARWYLFDNENFWTCQFFGKRFFLNTLENFWELELSIWIFLTRCRTLDWKKSTHDWKFQQYIFLYFWIFIFRLIFSIGIWICICLQHFYVNWFHFHVELCCRDGW